MPSIRKNPHLIEKTSRSKFDLISRIALLLAFYFLGYKLNCPIITWQYGCWRVRGSGHATTSPLTVVCVLFLVRHASVSESRWNTLFAFTRYECWHVCAAKYPHSRRGYLFLRLFVVHVAFEKPRHKKLLSPTYQTTGFTLSGCVSDGWRRHCTISARLDI